MQGNGSMLRIIKRLNEMDNCKVRVEEIGGKEIYWQFLIMNFDRVDTESILSKRLFYSFSLPAANSG
jgi:hypothetical protein